MSDLNWNPTIREFQQQQEQASEAFLEELFQDRSSRDSAPGRSPRDRGTNLPEDLSGLTTEEIRNLPASTIRALTSAQLHSLTDIQLKALTVRQLRELRYRGLQGRPFQALLANPHVDDILVRGDVNPKLYGGMRAG